MKKIIQYLTMILFLIIVGNAEASNQIKRPSSDLQVTGAWSIIPASPATGYSHVSETAADDSALIYATSAGRIVFGIGNGASIFPFTIPSEAISTTVTVFYRAKNNTGTTGTMASSLRIAGVAYDNPVCLPLTTSYVNYSYNYVTNPATGIEWTANEINSVGSNSLAAFGLYTSNAAGNPICTQSYLTVTYALPNGYTNVEDFGFTGVDDSAAFYWAVAAAGSTLNSTVFVPKEDSAWLVKPTAYIGKNKGCIAPSDNMTILMADGTTICPVAGSVTANANNVMFELLNANGVTITSNGAWHGYMRKEEFTQPSQFNHFVSYRSANGCSISNGAISGTGGDCIFVGSEQSYAPCTNITISNMSLDKASRHALGVNNVDTLLVQGSILSNSSGAGTSCGIDFESDWGGNTIYASQFKNISVYHCDFSGNTEAAILFHWGLLNGSDPKANTVTVIVEGCTISAYGFLNMTGIKSVGPIFGGPVGSVTINDCILNSISGRALWLASHDSTTAMFTFSNNTFSNFCLDGATQLNLINVDATYPLAGTYYGNFTFTNNIFNDSRGATNYILEAFKQVSTAGFFGLYGSANSLIGSATHYWNIPTPRDGIYLTGAEPTILPNITDTPTATPTATPTVTPTPGPAHKRRNFWKSTFSLED